MVYILLFLSYYSHFALSTKYEIQKTSIDINNVKLAVTYGLPLNIFNTNSSFPVLLEYLPYRKDDSMYPERFSYLDYFASSGFIYGFIDIRGTGGSEGERIAYEYSDVEIEDYIQIIEKVSKYEWTLSDGLTTIKSNGKVGLWGQSWSACSLFVLAGKKARDSRLEPLKTAIPIHCAVDLYNGDIHYMDGIFHMDEYILSVDHETMLPSYGFGGAASVNTYPLDQDYIARRVIHTL